MLNYKRYLMLYLINFIHCLLFELKEGIWKQKWNKIGKQGLPKPATASSSDSHWLTIVWSFTNFCAVVPCSYVFSLTDVFLRWGTHMFSPTDYKKCHTPTAWCFYVRWELHYLPVSLRDLRQHCFRFFSYYLTRKTVKTVANKLEGLTE